MRVWGLAAVLGLVLAAPATAGAAEWLAGDGHVHTCYSHDAWCGPGDDEGQDAFYSFGGTVPQRFMEASAKGLDFLVISDHNDVRAHTDPGFGTQGVLGVHAYEASLQLGHAQMIGARKVYPRANGADGANMTASLLRADGGFFQANHPADSLSGPRITTCAEAASDRMSWRYGFSVLPDTVEVWNATTMIQPSELFWECWLQRGARLGALAGSDSHGANHLNIGLPTTWVYAASANEADVIAALRAGRTTLSRVPPNAGGVRLLLEGDPNRDGQFEAMVGEEVPPRTPLRVRADNLPSPGLVRIRANGKTLHEDEQLAPGGEFAFAAPADAGWVRAVLYLEGNSGAVNPACEPPEETGAPPISLCSEDFVTAAMTSPIWVDLPALAPKVDQNAQLPPPGNPEPPIQPPLPPSEQGGKQPMPDVPPQRGKAGRVTGLLATWFRKARAHHRSLRVRLRWKSPEGPWRVEARRPGGKWRSLAAGTRRRGAVFRLKRGPWELRVQARPPQAEPSGWRSVKIRL
jgi:hypothetical protein